MYKIVKSWNDSMIGEGKTFIAEFADRWEGKKYLSKVFDDLSKLAITKGWKIDCGDDYVIIFDTYTAENKYLQYVMFDTNDEYWVKQYDI